MCYSNSATTKNIDLSKRYRKSTNSISDEITYYANGFNFPNWRVVTNEESIKVMRWGLIPNWFKGNDEAEIARMTLNARVESVREKASFKSILKRGRCIIPSTGFFEWKHAGNKRTPFFIFPSDDIVFSMAGLFDVWETTNSLVYSFSILTCEANDFMAEIHNVKKRMPVILSPSNELNWLCGEGEVADYTRKSIPKMEAHPVDPTIITGADSNVPEVQKKHEPKNSQLSLF
jgi:putative SOS response-associated peptidase YedK